MAFSEARRQGFSPVSSPTSSINGSANNLNKVRLK